MEHRKLSVAAWASGLAGLLPAFLALIATYTPGHSGAGLIVGFFYASLILSFLGGLWWGAAQRDGGPAWVFVVANVPALTAFAAGLIWLWDGGPRVPLLIIGVAILLTPLVDLRLARLGLVNRSQLRLRLILSAGLGVLTLALALRA